MMSSKFLSQILSKSAMGWTHKPHKTQLTKLTKQSLQNTFPAKQNLLYNKHNLLPI